MERSDFRSRLAAFRKARRFVLATTHPRAGEDPFPRVGSVTWTVQTISVAGGAAHSS